MRTTSLVHRRMIVLRRNQRIVTIIPDSYPPNIAKHLEQFSSAMLSSKWLKEFTAAYDIPGPTLLQVISMATSMRASTPVIFLW